MIAVSNACSNSAMIRLHFLFGESRKLVAVSSS